MFAAKHKFHEMIVAICLWNYWNIEII